MIRIKEKTKLRKIIMDSLDTTGELDRIEFYDDGTWTIMPQSTYTNHSVSRRTVGSMIHNGSYEGYTIKHYHKAITENFVEVEAIINEKGE